MIRSGREDGFAEAFPDLFRRAERVARRILGDEAAAEDAAAEALIRAFVAWPRIRELAHRDGWVLKTTSHVALDMSRRHGPRVEDNAAADPQDVIALRLALVGALRALPRRQREVIVLRFLSDLAEADVAASLGISSGSVKTHLHRGLASLRRQLREPNVSTVFQRM